MNIAILTHKSCNDRSASGSAFIELGLLAIVLVAMAILCVDIGMVAWGTSRNDEACRDAARAAADGRDRADALNRAETSLIAHKADGFWLTTPVVDRDAFVFQDFRGANPGGGNMQAMPSQPPPGDGPFVTVTTRAEIKVPVPLAIFGARFGHDKIKAVKSFTYPLVKVQVN